MVTRIATILRESVGQPDTLRARLSPTRVALLYLTFLSGAEALTVFAEPWTGVILYSVLLMALLLHAAMVWEQAFAKLLVALAFIPLIRLLSLSLPLAGLPQLYWYLVMSVPLLATVVIFVRTFGLSWREVGLNLRGLPLQLLVLLSGIVLGLIEYLILRPQPLVESPTLEQVWLPALILLVCTGFVEEIIFRGLMQRAATAVLGRMGVLYVAAIFAVLHLGYKSLADLVFVFAVAVYFGWVVARTGSLLGVTAAHGLMNALLFLILPFASLGDMPVVSLPPMSAATQGAVAVDKLQTPMGINETAASGGFPAPQAGVHTNVSPTVTPSVSPSATPTGLSAKTPSVTPTPVLTPTPTADAGQPLIPGSSPTAQPQTRQVRPKAVVITFGLNVRVGPGIEYPVLTVVGRGDEFEIVGRNAAGHSLLVTGVPWYGVGWVWTGGVESTASLDELPVVGTR